MYNPGDRVTVTDPAWEGQVATIVDVVVDPALGVIAIVTFESPNWIRFPLEFIRKAKT